MIIDTSAAARRAASERVREWLGEQRVFISSAMADTAEQRRAVAAVVEEEEARAVWFEEFGRDADAQEAYLTQVDSSTVYVGMANEIYGRPNPPDGFSATEMEYMRARDGGKRLGFFVAAEAPRREGHMARFIERVRFYLTTENFTDAPDLARRVRRRLRELAAEALSPWVKLGDHVFRADEIDDVGDAVTIRGRASDEIAHQLQILRDQPHRQTDLRLVYRNRVVVGQLAGLRRTTKTGGSELAVELSRVQPPPANTMRAGTSERSAGDLVELGVRALLLGEPLPDSLRMLESLTDTGIDVEDLRQAFDQPNETAEAITYLVVADGLVGSGGAGRVVSLSLGPRNGDRRRMAIQWEETRVYSNVAPRVRTVEGEWRRP